ncbi:MAG TPA: aliphatic sulfonate ABC transporter substrate-binding protein [Polyangiaceae bacterium]|nr:aliphatic sulfonate ABC transporter substrate-binding protein [Polyangiaceae bacterium]
MPVLTLPNADHLPLSVRAKALVFEDPLSRALLARIHRVAPSQATVLITGETGTGKEIVARHLHDSSQRRDKPFAAVNCGAFSESLAEAELFGHERGAFTGAQTSKAGWFETAHGGTLFLDEIGDLSLPLQVKLLRVLQEGEVVRVGSRQPIPIDVRLVAATNVDLRQAMSAGHFREDLFYRLNVTMLELPPLRERPGDIMPLARHFLEGYVRRLGVGAAQLSPGAERRLLDHAWPGNIRELENAIHHALLVCKAGEIQADDLGLMPAALAVSRKPIATPQVENRLDAALAELFEQNLPNLHEHVESALIRGAYRYCHNNQLQTARLLGVSRNVVRARLIQFGEIQGSLRGERDRGSDRPPPLEREAASEREPASERVPATQRAANGVGAGEATLSEHAPLREPPRSDTLVPSRRTLRIGYQKFGVLSLVKLHGALDASLAKSGLRIEWRQYAAGLPIIDALQAHELELGVVGECPPLFAQADDVPLVYLAAEEAAPEREAILVHRDSAAQSVSDLRGKSIALHRGSNVHYLVIRALEEAGVPYDEVELVFLAPEAARGAFERRDVDAWAIWDPMLSSVRYDLGARILRNGAGLAKNVAYYVARRPFAESHPSVIGEFLSHVALAGAWAKDNAAAVADLLAPELGVPRGVLALAFLNGASPVPLSSELLLGQQQIADTLHRLQLIPRAIRVAEAQWQPRLAG